MDKAVLVEQDDIAMTAHNLDNQRLADGIAELIGVLEVKIENPLKSCRADVEQTGTGQVLAQQHAEHRRRSRVVSRIIGQVNPGCGWICRQQKPAVLSVVSQLKDQFKAVRLINPVNARVCQRLIEFGCQAVDRYAV